VSEDECHAHRLAGRAVAAVLVGRRIESASFEDGITTATEGEDPSVRRSDVDILRWIFIILMGVAAQQAYGFGFLPGDVVLLMPRPDDPEGMDDVELADELSLELAEINRSGLGMVWRYAAGLVGQPDVWQAIEAVAEALSEHRLDHDDVMSLCLSAGACRSTRRA